MADGFGKYDVYAVFGSDYCYRDSDVLINHFGILDGSVLRQVEADITAIRQSDLLVKPVPGRFTTNHLCRIHKYLFGDIYPFAGHLRREDIMKGTTRFLGHKEIKEALSSLLSQLHREHQLNGLGFDVLVARSAYYFAELNYIHPFREGNGRTIREFMRLIYDNAGYEIHWNAISPELLLQAMEASVYRTTLLEDVLFQCLTIKAQ